MSKVTDKSNLLASFMNGDTEYPQVVYILKVMESQYCRAQLRLRPNVKSFNMG